MHIKAVSVAVPEPLESGEFFRRVLDLPVFETDGSVRVEFGSSTLLIHKGETEPGGYYHLAFDIPENTVIAARDLLRSRTLILPAGDDGVVTASDAWNAHSIYFNAPGNLNLELIARHRLHNQAASPFTFADIQSISEVGIPVDDLPDAIEKIGASLGIEPFAPPSDTFAPFGSDDGLLILVKTGRIWFPTPDQGTTMRPLDITIEGVSPTLALTPTATIRGIGS